MTQYVPSPGRRRHTVYTGIQGPGLPWVDITPMPSAVADARRMVRERLAQADPDFVYNVQLVASELVTNAIRLVRAQEAPSSRFHPGIWISIEARPRWTHLRVRDPYPKVLPMKRQPEAMEESGRGVLISEVVADYVWVEVSPMDKVVHAVFTKPGVTLSQGDIASFGR